MIPERHSFAALLRSPRIKLTTDLLQQAGAQSGDYGELVRDIVGLLRGTYRSPDGLDPHPVPGQGAQVEPWVLGSSAGQSASVAGELGLRFAANYHVSPATVLEAVDAYRAAFVPSADLDRPYVAVSADVVVGPDDATARELAAGYGLWVRSIRRGEGAIEFPTPEEAARHRWSDEDRARGCRPGRQPVRGIARDGRRRARTAPRSDRCRRTGDHHHHPRSRRPCALLRAPGQGVA